MPGYKPKHDPYLAYFKNQIPKVLPKSQGFLGKADFDTLTEEAFKISPRLQRTIMGRIPKHCSVLFKEDKEKGDISL